MRAVAEESRSWIPETGEDKKIVLQQMNRLLETPHFRNSRRYPALFRYIVEETLEGRGEYLKERLLGVTVFGKSPDYDTAADPTVRVSVAEIRKRIAQYYHDDAHTHELRIDIQPGRYQPEFRLSRPQRDIHDSSQDDHNGSASSAETSSNQKPIVGRAPEHIFTPADAIPSETALLEVAPRIAAKKSFSKSLVHIFTLAMGSFLLLAISAGLLWRTLHRTPILELWGPLHDAKGPILIALPGGPGAHDFNAMRALLNQSGDVPPVVLNPQTPGTTDATGPPPTFLSHMVLDQNVVFADTLGMAKVLSILALEKRDYTIRLSGDTSLDELRRGPSVLIGGLDNAWTLRVIGRLRFRFAADDHYQCWIYDSKGSSNERWLLDLKKRYEAVNRDYAIIARVHNEQTGMPQIVIAGLGMSGTVAASEYFVDPELSKKLRDRIGSRFADHDFEAVVSTDVVNGVAGSPAIQAVEVW